MVTLLLCAMLFRPVGACSTHCFDCESECVEACEDECRSDACRGRCWPRCTAACTDCEGFCARWWQELVSLRGGDPQARVLPVSTIELTLRVIRSLFIQERHVAETATKAGLRALNHADTLQTLKRGE